MNGNVVIKAAVEYGATLANGRQLSKSTTMNINGISE